MHKLKEITLPILDTDFSTNLAEMFENINENFKKLSSPDLMRGRDGNSAIYITYNLNSVFFYPVQHTKAVEERLTSATVPESYNIKTINELRRQVDADYEVFRSQTGQSKEEYVKACIAILRNLFPEEKSGEKKRDKAITLNKKTYYGEWVREWLNHPSEKTFNTHIGTFSPGRISMAVVDGRQIGCLPYMHIDPRFRNTDVNTKADWSGVLDCSGIFLCDFIDGEPVFKKIDSSQQMYFEDGEFFWQINGIKTKVSAQGLRGPAGKNSEMLIIQRLENAPYKVEKGRPICKSTPVQPAPTGRINPGDFTEEMRVKEVYESWAKNTNNESRNKNKYRIWNVLGWDNSPFWREAVTDGTSPTYTLDQEWKGQSESVVPVSELDPTGPELYTKLREIDGTSCIVLPDPQWQRGKFFTTFWISTIRVIEVGVGNDKRLLATVFCGEENRMVLGLDEHTFVGMMMGLDPHEYLPHKWADHNKARGLLVPIGSRMKILEQGKESETFGTHILYSDGGTVDKVYNTHSGRVSEDQFMTDKRILHIGSVKDLRALNHASSTNAAVPGRLRDNKTSNNNLSQGYGYTHYVGAEVHIDAPTTITSYKSTGWREGNLLDVYGDVRVGPGPLDTAVGGLKIDGMLRLPEGGSVIAGGDINNDRPINYTTSVGVPLMDHIYKVPFWSGVTKEAGNYYSSQMKFGLGARFITSSSLYIGQQEGQITGSKILLTSDGATFDVPEIRSYTGKWNFHNSTTVTYGMEKGTDDYNTMIGYKLRSGDAGKNQSFYYSAAATKFTPTAVHHFVDDSIYKGAVIAENVSSTDVLGKRYSGIFKNGLYVGGTVSGPSQEPTWSRSVDINDRGGFQRPATWSDVNNVYGHLQPIWASTFSSPVFGDVSFSPLSMYTDGAASMESAVVRKDLAVKKSIITSGPISTETHLFAKQNLLVGEDAEIAGDVMGKAFARRGGKKQILLANGHSTEEVLQGPFRTSDGAVSNVGKTIYSEVTKSPIVLDLGPTYGKGRLIKFGEVGGVSVDEAGSLTVIPSEIDTKNVLLGQYSPDGAYWSSKFNSLFGYGNHNPGFIEASKVGSHVSITINVLCDYNSEIVSGKSDGVFGIGGRHSSWKHFAGINIDEQRYINIGVSRVGPLDDMVYHDNRKQSLIETLPPQFRPQHDVTLFVYGNSHNRQTGDFGDDPTIDVRLSMGAPGFIELVITPDGKISRNRSYKPQDIYPRWDGYKPKYIQFNVTYTTSDESRDNGLTTEVHTKYVTLSNVDPENISFTASQATYSNEAPSDDKKWVLLGTSTTNNDPQPDSSTPGWNWSVISKPASIYKYQLSTQQTVADGKAFPSGRTKNVEATTPLETGYNYKWMKEGAGDWILVEIRPGFEEFTPSWSDNGGHQVMTSNRLLEGSGTGVGSYKFGSMSLQELVDWVKNTGHRAKGKESEVHIMNFSNGRLIYTPTTVVVTADVVAGMTDTSKSGRMSYNNGTVKFTEF